MSIVDQTQDLGLGTTTDGLLLARVNLLPPEIEEARKLRGVQIGLGAGLAAVAVVIGGVYMVAAGDKHSAEDELAASKATTVQLQKEQAKYADVPRTIAAIDAAEEARSTAMANDVEWYRTLNNLALTIPNKVWFTNLSVTTSNTTPTATTATAGSNPQSGTATGATTVPVGIGVLTIQGTASNHTDVATWLDTLARQPGMSNAYFSNSTRAKIGDTPVVNFSSTANITDAALSHRYDRKQG